MNNRAYPKLPDGCVEGMEYTPEEEAEVVASLKAGSPGMPSDPELLDWLEHHIEHDAVSDESREVTDVAP